MLLPLFLFVALCLFLIFRDFFKMVIKMVKGTLTLLLLLVCMSSFSQTAIKVPGKVKTVQTFVNKQGFKLPVSVKDTTNVYQTIKGSLYYWRLSKNNNLYKVYLPKVSKG